MNDSYFRIKNFIKYCFVVFIHHLKEKEMDPVVTLASSSEKGNLETQIEQRGGIRSHPTPGRAVGCESHCERRDTLPESDRDCQST